MTFRAVSAWGLIAGVPLPEQREMRPGFLLDLFVLRRAYDDEQHGISRKKQDHDISDDDRALFDEEVKEEDGGPGD